MIQNEQQIITARFFREATCSALEIPLPFHMTPEEFDYSQDNVHDYIVNVLMPELSMEDPWELDSFGPGR